MMALCRLTLFLAAGLLGISALHAQRSRPLRVGVGGAEPFVVREADTRRGISVEVWQTLAAQAGWRYEFKDYGSGPEVMLALRNGHIDVAVGPISITAERASYSLFSQPYFSSHIAILSRTEAPTPFQRVAPFFTRSFFLAVASLLTVLAIVGTLVWLAERRGPNSHFPQNALHGIGNGIWFAIVTMSTVGYGDMSPRTVLGRMVTAIWIVISVIAATSLVAGIASTLTLTGINAEVISTAEQMRGRTVAVLAQSPNEAFAARHGARIRGVNSLPNAYALLERREVDAIVFDRPQLQYFMRQQSPAGSAISPADYGQQDYGFALATSSRLQRDLDLNLLQLRESGGLARIVGQWLGGE